MKTKANMNRGFVGCILVFIFAMMMSMPVSAASKVKLNKTSATVVVGKTVQLNVKNTSKKVTWTSSKKSVATVSKSGKVTAKKAGTATITAKVGSKKLKCKVTVKSNVWNNSNGNNIYSWADSSWIYLAICNQSQSLNFVHAQPLKISYNSKKQLVAQIVVLNKTLGYNYYFNQITVTINDKNGAPVAIGTFDLDETVISPFGTVTCALTFDEGSTKQVINLRNTEFSWTISTN
ncbi:MAG: Ig-like domain-containing protein [Lachnospiraceae bacterium]|nr:Ig-like domain-containing protein [Lachnospiraceae bacterium]